MAENSASAAATAFLTSLADVALILRLNSCFLNTKSTSFFELAERAAEAPKAPEREAERDRFLYQFCAHSVAKLTHFWQY